MIIGIEGLPGAGKSTLVERLPYPKVPEMLVTKDEEATFTDADYLEHDKQKYRLAQRLGQNGVCLMDRTTLSSHAYAFASGDIDEASLPIETGEDIHYLYLAITPELSLERQLPGLWESSIDFRERTARFYDRQFQDTPRRIATIDGSRSLDEVAADAYAAIELARKSVR